MLRSLPPVGCGPANCGIRFRRGPSRPFVGDSGDRGAAEASSRLRQRRSRRDDLHQHRSRVSGVRRSCDPSSPPRPNLSPRRLRMWLRAEMNLLRLGPCRRLRLRRLSPPLLHWRLRFRHSPALHRARRRISQGLRLAYSTGGGRLLRFKQPVHRASLVHRIFQRHRPTAVPSRSSPRQQRHLSLPLFVGLYRRGQPQSLPPRLQGRERIRARTTAMARPRSRHLTSRLAAALPTARQSFHA